MLGIGANTLLLSYLLNEYPSFCSPAGEVVAGKKTYVLIILLIRKVKVFG